MFVNILLLTPDSILDLNQTRLISDLTDAGFIGESFDYHGQTHYKPGEEFLHLITFLGCSPVVSLGEVGTTGDEFAHVQFSGPTSKAQFIGGENIKPIRCSQCGERDTTWREQLSQWLQQGEDGEWSCPHCNTKTPLTKIKWRKAAGLGHFFIKVWGVFENEAVPGDKLLQVIRESSNSSWSYFYYRGNELE